MVSAESVLHVTFADAEIRNNSKVTMISYHSTE